MRPTQCLLLSLTLLSACAAKNQQTVRTKAAEALMCSADKITVDAYNGHDSTGYRAHGCERTTIYNTDCNLLYCAVTGRGEIKEDPENIEFTKEAYRRAVEAGDERQRKAKEMRARKVEVALFSKCDKDVLLGVGTDGQPAGSWELKAGTMERLTVDQDDHIWVTDEARTAVQSKIKPDRQQPIYSIVASCDAIEPFPEAAPPPGTPEDLVTMTIINYCPRNVTLFFGDLAQGGYYEPIHPEQKLVIKVPRGSVYITEPGNPKKAIDSGAAQRRNVLYINRACEKFQLDPPL